MMVLRVILKGILKVYFRLIISSLMRNFGKLAIKYKLGLRLFLFFTCKAHSIWCVAHSVYCRVQGKRKFLHDRKYIAIHQHFLNQLRISKSFTSDTRTENMVFLREVCPWNEFERLYFGLVLLLIILDRRVK